MISRRYRVLLAIICTALAIARAATANTEPDRALMNDLIQTIAKVRTGESATVRTDAAERLSRLAKRMKPQDVDDKTLSDLVSLLDTHEDSVRAWVAASLGNLGPRAKVAAPRLLEILAQVECIPVVGGLTSEGAIRLALKRMGVKVPPPPDCEKSPIAPTTR
jgi:hypothetical protein